MIPLGEKEKMTIRAYTEASPQNWTPVGEPYTFQVNPSSYTHRHQLNLENTCVPGTSGSTVKYNCQTPNVWNFEILIDGTGVIKDAGALDIALIGNTNPVDVEAEVKKLRKLVLEYNGSTHRNNYLTVAWGKKDLFKGTLESLEFEYKLFKPEGTPLRVIAKLGLKEWVSQEERTRQDDASSPDITHQRTFTGSDRIDLMTHRIYNTPAYYLDVANANQLNSFRKIQTGATINLPPLK